MFLIFSGHICVFSFLGFVAERLTFCSGALNSGLILVRGGWAAGEWWALDGFTVYSSDGGFGWVRCTLDMGGCAFACPCD